jgi:hypothetical protein
MFEKRHAEFEKNAPGLIAKSRGRRLEVRTSTETAISWEELKNVLREVGFIDQTRKMPGAAVFGSLNS